jgi:hypothetical protein
MNKEELAKEYANNWEEIYPELDSEDMTPIEISRIDFMAGFDKATEIMYSEEEVYNILLKHTEYFFGNGERMSLTEWFDQFKLKQDETH